MKNNNLKTGQPKRGLADHPAVIAAQVGYSEARAGRPFNPDRFSDQISQSNHEIGRLWCINMRVACIDPPPWPIRRNLPAIVQKRLRQSFDSIGGCQPGNGDGR
jgi:hypothetical protein